jgi:Arc/MetJ-type ribon-helix-helix transcriptional regulator
MSSKVVRRSLAMTQEMRDRLQQLLNKRGREISESDLIREAIRHFLDDQDDLIGSRRHFQKSFQDRVDRLEYAHAFQLNVLIYLLALALSQMLPQFTKERVTVSQLLQQAIIAARRDGDKLLAQIEAVRDMPDQSPKPSSKA